MLLDYRDFIVGALSVAMAYALFKDNAELDGDELENNEEYEEDRENGRTVIMSCQGCRKLKRHREIEHNLYQCVKCKRHVDLRRKKQA